MKTSIETITPQQAAKWLAPDVNHDNRALRQDSVTYLAKQILAGKWQTTHQGVAFSKSGRLIDGQHRLSAIVLAGRAVQMMVSTGLEDDSFKVVDCGLKRSHFERVHLVDDSSSNRLLCMVITQFLRGTGRQGASIAVSEIENVFLAYDGKMTDSWLWLAREWSTAPRGGIARGGVLASLGIYHYVNPAMACAFNDGYRSGARLDAGSPILALRHLVTTYPTRVSYWVAQAAMRSHLGNRTVSKIFAASEDMLGNKNSIRVLRERSEKSKKGNETKRKVKAGA